MPRPLYASDTERLRRVHRVAVMFYQEGRSQAEIAESLGISPASVNRMVREAHERGLVEIRIRAPFGPEAALSKSLERLTSLERAVVVESPSSDPLITLKAVAEAASTALLDVLDDGMTVAVSGGVALCALIEAIRPARSYAVRVVPATGGIQGKFRTDVNHVAVALAEKLGGSALQLHAPVFGATREERDALVAVSTIRSVLDIARAADVAVFGIGSVVETDSTYLTLTDGVDRAGLERAGATGELLAHLVGVDGRPSPHPSNDRLVALTLEELARIPHRLAIASGPTKVVPITAVLRSGSVGTLVTDAATAKGVVDGLNGGSHADGA